MSTSEILQAGAAEVLDADSGSHGSRYLYRHLPVNFENGAQLMDFPPSTRVEVYATDVSWHYGTTPETLVTKPTGDGGSAPHDFRFPDRPRFSIVLYQDGGPSHLIEGDSPGNALQYEVKRDVKIRFAVNDRRGTYYDNSGAYNIYIRRVSND